MGLFWNGYIVAIANQADRPIRLFPFLESDVKIWQEVYKDAKYYSFDLTSYSVLREELILML